MRKVGSVVEGGGVMKEKILEVVKKVNLREYEWKG